MFLNGGYGYFNQHKVYTYDMSNLEMIKSNLKNIILPKIFIFCYIENEEISFSTPEFRSIIINEYNYDLKYKNELNNVNIDYKNPESLKLTDEQIKDISMDIILYFIHKNLKNEKYLYVGQEIFSLKKIIKDEELLKRILLQNLKN